MAGPDIKNIETLADPIPVKETAWPQPETKNLDALLDSLNGSAERFQTLWFSFLGLTLYFAIAALTTTHRDLLLGEPKTLPLLNIQVPLLPFYVIAPLLYLVLHFYLLMMLTLLARTAAEFDKQLRMMLPDEAERERYRARIENALFLQLLVGMKGERTGFNAFLLGLIALMTVVLAPLATLILMQMMFLPYHHFRITWWHRGIVVADFVLIVLMTYRCFFPRGFRKAPLVLGALSRKRRWAAAMAFCILLAIALAPVLDWLSFRQGRWAGEPNLSFREWRWWAGKPPAFAKGDPDYASTANGVVFGLFPDRLKLKDETIVGEKKLEETDKEIDSRGDFVPTIKLDGRDLQAADLSGADLRGVSLSAAAMQAASLVNTRLDGARLSCVPQGDAEVCAQLQGGFLLFAQLQGANLRGAQLQRAYLGNAWLQGANLDLADLQGTFLGGAQLQGADLRSARLQGAYLGYTQLQGADLSWAELAVSEFNGAFVFRTNIADADLEMATVRSAQAGQVKVNSDWYENPPEPLKLADVEAWIAAATKFARGNQKDEIVKRFGRLKKDFQTPDQDAGDIAKWQSPKESYPSIDRQRLAEFFADLACERAGAPVVALRFVNSYRLPALGDQLAAFRTRLKEGRKAPEKCPGVVGFTEEDWRKLEAIKPGGTAPTNP